MRRAIPSQYLVLLFSVLLMLAYNNGLWEGIVQANQLITQHNLLFLGSCAIFMTALFNLIFNLVSSRYLIKPILIFIVLCSAAASYFIDSYGVHIDSSMIQNVLETDTAETKELLSQDFIIHFLLWGILPAFLIAKLRIAHVRWTKQLLMSSFSITMSILAMGLVAAFFYQDYASTFRNHRDLRYLINPTSYIYAVTKIAKQQFAEADKPLIPISQNAALGSFAHEKKHRTVTVMVVGETARAESFHLNGYERETTPELEKTNSLYFNNVSSCGTATATSVPCMFSQFSRDDYDDEKGHGYESVLDAISAAGVKVSWLDNNSGCKGVCDRVEHQKVTDVNLAELCPDGECYDEVLLTNLKALVAKSDGDQLIVLHQKGSHGPAYFKRVPAAFEKYKPVCQTSELQKCSNEELRNAYDNTILYTDHVLAQLIQYLDNLSSQSIDTAMIYVSDHGESLGEHNLYLHGTPYFAAPSQQTHVPMVVWLSDNYERDYHINPLCMKNETGKAVSHDNIFHSLLGMNNVLLPGKYDPALDIFASCQHS